MDHMITSTSKVYHTDWQTHRELLPNKDKDPPHPKFFLFANTQIFFMPTTTEQHQTADKQSQPPDGEHLAATERLVTYHLSTSWDWLQPHHDPQG